MHPLIQKIIFRLDPERAHNAAIWALRYWPFTLSHPPLDPILHSSVWGIDFANPVGLAAGFDKNADVGDKMLALGFGFAEMGTVTPKPQIGNPQPRLFRLPQDRAVINRMGFNNLGLDHYCKNLRRIAHNKPAQGIIGANVGMNRDSADRIGDIRIGLQSVYALADYMVINISSPNTPGLRDWQTGDGLIQLIDAAQQVQKSQSQWKPMLFKIAPDLTYDQLEFIAQTALDKKLDGIIIGNTTIARAKELESPFRSESGGLSGRPLFRPSTLQLRQLYRFTNGKIPLIGVGGIGSAQDAYKKIKAGASLVQLYTSMVYYGPTIVQEICQGLAKLLRADGYGSVAQAIGAETAKKFDDNLF